jgi:hypothetical protein
MEFSDEQLDEATGDEKFDTMMGQIQREPKYPDSQMPPTDVKDLYQWAVKNNKPYHKIFAEWANREGYKSVAPALQRAGDLDTEALDYWTPRVWKIYWGEVRGIDSEMPPEWSKKRVPDELRDYLETVFDAYDRIVFDWPTEYRQIGGQGVAEGIVDALKGSWEKVKNFDSPARSTSNTQRYQDLRKRQELKRKQIKNQVPVNELSTDKLAQYKTAAALDAGAADKRGDYERGDKRFAGIIKATKKQFANDLKKHGQQGMAEGAPISGDGGAVDNFKQQMANNTEIAYQKGMAEAKKKKKKKSSRSLGRYFFPGYGYYGSGESGEGGGDGGGGEGESVNRAVAEGSSTASDAVERAI